ncbi:MAG: DinB family protein [Caldilineaceae bacterium]|nr:DinB family protein [Caldilineaceae bacterium]
MSVIGTLLRVILERSSRTLTYGQALEKLHNSGESTANRIGKGADTPKNRKQAAHIIGIERWGQRRLKVVQGEPLVIDEYDSYRPTEELSMAEMGNAFHSARQTTLALVSEMQRDGVPLTKEIFHNQAQDLTLRAWLNYLNSHASRESMRIR